MGAGARTTTVLQRLTSLPHSDALVTEDGGRIFVHDSSLPTAARFVEDTDWCRAGMPTYNPSLPCADLENCVGLIRVASGFLLPRIDNLSVQLCHTAEASRYDINCVECRRQQHTPVAGPPEQVGVAPESKQGLLWETYRKLAADGFRLDDAGYSVSFRVKLKVC